MHVCHDSELTASRSSTVKFVPFSSTESIHFWENIPRQFYVYLGRGSHLQRDVCTLSHWKGQKTRGRVRWRLPSSFSVLCSNKSDIVWIQWKLGSGGGRVAWYPESSYWARDAAALRPGRQCSRFVLPHIVIRWLLFVKTSLLLSRTAHKQDQILVFLWLYSFVSRFIFKPFQKLLHVFFFQALSLLIQMTGFLPSKGWART